LKKLIFLLIYTALHNQDRISLFGSGEEGSRSGFATLTKMMISIRNADPVSEEEKKSDDGDIRGKMAKRRNFRVG